MSSVGDDTVESLRQSDLSPRIPHDIRNRKEIGLLFLANLKFAGRFAPLVGRLEDFGGTLKLNRFSLSFMNPSLI